MSYFTDICFRGSKEELDKIFRILNVGDWSRTVDAREIIKSINTAFPKQTIPEEILPVEGCVFDAADLEQRLFPPDFYGKVTLWTESTRDNYINLWKWFASLFKDVEFLYKSENEEDGIFVTNDKEGEEFPDLFYVSAYIPKEIQTLIYPDFSDWNDDEYYTEYFSSTGDLCDALSTFINREFDRVDAVQYYAEVINGIIVDIYDKYKVDAYFNIYKYKFEE